MTIIDRDPLHLCPKFFALLDRFISEWNTENPLHTVAIFEGLRSFERQTELYASSRTVPGPKLTNAPPGMSWHQYGLAADLVFDADPVRPGPQWTWDGKQPWPMLGKAGYYAGLEWAGAWVYFPEFPHFQKTFNMKLVEAHTLFQQGGLAAVWKAIV